MDDAYAELGQAARWAVEPVVAALAGAPLPPHLVAVGLAFDFRHEDPLVTVDLEMLGNDLRIGIERTTSKELQYVARDVAILVRCHGARVDAASRAMGARAVGWISEAALRIVDAAGIERRSAIGTVHAHGSADLTFAAADGRKFWANLLHTDGEIVGSVMPHDRRWSLTRDRLVTWGEGLPEVLRASLEGRRLGQLFQSGELPGAAVVVSVEEVTSVDPEADCDDEADGWLRLGLDVPLLEIDAATGEVETQGSTLPAATSRHRLPSTPRALRRVRAHDRPALDGHDRRRDPVRWERRA